MKTTTSHTRRAGRRMLALIAALLASLLVSTAAPAQAAEGVAVTVAYGGSAKLVVSPCILLVSLPSMNECVAHHLLAVCDNLIACCVVATTRMFGGIFKGVLHLWKSL